jgi:DNA-binding beta-propeller fold protein YncE
MRTVAVATIRPLLVVAIMAGFAPVVSADAGGLTVTWLGEWRGGEGENALQAPVALALDGAGNVYVAEQTGNAKVFTADGRFIRRLGAPLACAYGCPSGANDGRFFLPEGLGVDSAGFVYVADMGPGGRGRVQKFAPDGAFVRAFEGIGLDWFHYPRDVTVDFSGGLYVADWGKSRVLHVDSGSGAFIREWGASEFHPWGVAVDEARRSVYAVTDNATSPIVALSLDGGLLARWGPGFPRGKKIEVDREGRVFVLGANIVTVFSAAGDLLGQWGSWGSGPGEFREATDVAVGEGGLAYVTDYVNRRVQVFRLEFDR